MQDAQQRGKAIYERVGAGVAGGGRRIAGSVMRLVRWRIIDDSDSHPKAPRPSGASEFPGAHLYDGLAQVAVFAAFPSGLTLQGRYCIFATAR